MLHVGDYRLFNHRQAVEFVSIFVRINEYIYKYQIIRLDALLNVEIRLKLDRPATSGSDQGSTSKWIIQTSKGDITAAYTTIATDGSTFGPITLGNHTEFK